MNNKINPGNPLLDINKALENNPACKKHLETKCTITVNSDMEKRLNSPTKEFKWIPAEDQRCEVYDGNDELLSVLVYGADISYNEYYTSVRFEFPILSNFSCSAIKGMSVEIGFIGDDSGYYPIHVDLDEIMTYSEYALVEWTGTGEEFKEWFLGKGLGFDKVMEM